MILAFLLSKFAAFLSLFFREGQPPKPEYGGPRWALYTHHLGSYMHRWIVLTPWGTIRLHHILRSDADRHLHDHPFDFTSILLTGAYVEGTFSMPGEQWSLPKISKPLSGHGRDDCADLPPHDACSANPRAEYILPDRVLKRWPRFSIVRKRAEDAHLLVLDRPVWTLVFAGPKRRDWGFHTERGWIWYRSYSAAFPENAASTKAIRP